MVLTLPRAPVSVIWMIAFLHVPIVTAFGKHDAAFWKSIADQNFAVPSDESIGPLALEIADLAAETDPMLRDTCGYEILAAWIYHKDLLSSEQLEALRRKLLPAMTFHIGESESDTVFRRSFSALYMSILAAQDLRKPFLSDAAFHETLATALQCYAEEKDLRGYLPEKGWTHATAHVADLLKFLVRNPKLTAEDQERIAAGAARRCRTASSVFVWGEDARIAAALLAIADRKDFEPSLFDEWLKAVIAENKELWKRPNVDIAAYVSVRTQSNVLAHLAAKIASQKDNQVPEQFRNALNTTLSQID
jgi:Protein of unknown function (DUF2785)